MAVFKKYDVIEISDYLYNDACKISRVVLQGGSLFAASFKIRLLRRKYPDRQYYIRTSDGRPVKC